MIESHLEDPQHQCGVVGPPEVGLPGRPRGPPEAGGVEGDDAEAGPVQRGEEAAPHAHTAARAVAVQAEGNPSGTK